MVLQNEHINEKDIILLGDISKLSEDDQRFISTFNVKDMYSAPSFTLADKLALLSEQNKNILFVVCASKKITARWADILVSYGMNYGENFVDLILFKHHFKKTANVTRKKLLVAYGNCQMEQAKVSKRRTKTSQQKLQHS